MSVADDMMRDKHGPPPRPAPKERVPAWVYLLIFAMLVTALVAVTALVLGALLVAGSWGVGGLVLAFAAVWIGVRA